MPTFYINGPSFDSATAIFNDAALTICAADGSYSDGISYRQQINCVLLPSTGCPSCATECGGAAITESPANGVYNLSVNLGAAVGAVVIRFNPTAKPSGFIAEYDGLLYNSLSSALEGFHGGTAGLPTYIGQTAQDCGIVAGSPWALTEYVYSGGVFVPFSSQNVTITAGQLDLSAFPTGDCYMVIPKTQTGPSDVNITITSACPISDWTVEIECPELLPWYGSSASPSVNSAAACLVVDLVAMYHLPIVGTAGVLGLHDWVFSDPYGENELPDGFYKLDSAVSIYDYYQVLNGVVVLLSTC